mgnify:CR=1 FL=1
MIKAIPIPNLSKREANASKFSKKFFNLEIPLDVYGLENDFLVPHHSWNNLEEYFSTGNMLTRPVSYTHLTLPTKA